MRRIGSVLLTLLISLTPAMGATCPKFCEGATQGNAVVVTSACEHDAANGSAPILGTAPCLSARVAFALPEIAAAGSAMTSSLLATAEVAPPAVATSLDHALHYRPPPPSSSAVLRI
jgi:hypothetical protein